MADESVTVEAAQPNVEVEATPADSTTTNNDSTEAVGPVEGEPTKADEKTEVPAKVEENKEEPAEAEVKESAQAAGDDTPKDGENKDTSMLKTTRRIDARQNIKFDPTCLPDTDDASQIRGQVQIQAILQTRLCKFANVALGRVLLLRQQSGWG